MWHRGLARPLRRLNGKWRGLCEFARVPEGETLMEELKAHQKRAAEAAVPWFVKEMPETYFRVVSPAVQRRHLRAITALSSPDLSVPEVKLTDQNAFSFLSIGSKREGASSSTKSAARQLASLPEDAELTRVLLFSSKDGRLSLNLFETASPTEAEPLFGKAQQGPAVVLEAAMRVKLSEYSRQLAGGEFVGVAGHPPPASKLSARELEQFLAKCSSRYVVQHVPRLLYRQLRLYQQVAGTEGVAIELEHDFDPSLPQSTLITAAIAGVAPRTALQQALQLLTMHGLSPRRAQVDSVVDSVVGSVTLLRLLVTPEGGHTPSEGHDWAQARPRLRRAKRSDKTAVRLPRGRRVAAA